MLSQPAVLIKLPGFLPCDAFVARVRRLIASLPNSTGHSIPRALKGLSMNTKQTSPEKPVKAIARTSAGLRDAIFDEIDAIRNGKSNPTRANAVAKLATGVIETVRMEMEVQRFAQQMELDRKTLDQHPVGSIVQLGG
jgi:hypothetical protein